MSEDTTAKPGQRRRRTTRSGRRKPLRLPDAGGESDLTPSQWPQTEAELAANAAPGGAHETGELFDGIEGGEPEEAADGEGACSSTQPPEAEASAGDLDDDTRDTAELVVTPATLAQLQDEDEKTQPRIRLPAGIFNPPPNDQSVTVWSKPQRAPEGATPSEGGVVVVRPAVVIAPARIISDRPPAPAAPSREIDALSLSLRQRAVQPPVADVPAADAPLSELLPAVTPAPAPAESEPLEFFESLESTMPPPATTPPPKVSPSPPPPPPAPRTPPPAAPAAQEAAPAVEPARTAPEPATETAAEDGSLQLFDDEDVAELDAQQKGRTPPPPPPPPEVRAKPAPPPPKRPPPPPQKPSSTSDEEKDRQKRKQVRQWWERFFSDDYLMSVLPPTQAQIAKQVDFIEQSLGLPKGATILDLGCGLGLHAVELSRRGYLVVGLDLSLAMITRAAEFAQEQNVKLNVVHADIREMEFEGAFDAVVCMGTTFGFFDDDSNRDVLLRMHQALRPGGRLLLDTVNRDYVIRFQPNLVWFEGDECVCMEESDFNYFNARLTVKRTLMREDGRQSQSEYSVRLYSLHELGQLMQQAGFRVIEVSGQEAIRGAFFGAHSPRVLMLAERRMPPRTTVTSPERSSLEINRPSLAFPPERGSAELPKIPPKSSE